MEIANLNVRINEITNSSSQQLQKLTQELNQVNTLKVELQKQLNDKNQQLRRETIEVQTANTIDSIRKQLAQANARAEEAERRLDDRDKNYNILYT